MYAGNRNVFCIAHFTIWLSDYDNLLVISVYDTKPMINKLLVFNVNGWEISCADLLALQI